VSTTVAVDLPRDGSAARIARAAMKQLRSNADVDLVVGELVNNAVIHGAAPITMRAVRNYDRIHIEVRDAGPVFVGGDADSRGLRIVEALSTNWGVRYYGLNGKAVWAELISPAGTITENRFG
jgi:anti-sigma regulatory factor (Ser/Thr protein kinase)